MSIEHRRVAKDFDRIAEQYDTHAVLQNELLLRALLYAEHYFPRHAKILDVGCGTGLFGSKARLQNPDWIIHGVDIAFGMAKLARKHSLALVADVNALPYPDAAFDSVFSGLCLQWLGDKPRAFREMARVIRPGGRAVMTCFGKHTLIVLRVAIEKA
ncbi:MAG: class I SAM-dependent methyltransferase [Alphaproteobacteria bacterium]